MKLIEALRLAKRSCEADGQQEPRSLFLACGFTPLHLEAFLLGEAMRRFGPPIALRTGLYGDLQGNIERQSGEHEFDCGFVVIEWVDVDPRLGFRTAGVRSDPSTLEDIIRTSEQRLRALKTSIKAATQRGRLCIALPSLPLPPRFPSRPEVGHPVALRLQELLYAFAADASSNPRIAILDSAQLDRRSPASGRHSARDELSSGFPYTLSHASALASMMVQIAFPSPTKKGLITDLDNTLWKGVVGDDGADGVSWDLDRNAHGHALYQELLADLSAQGTLLAVASKNDASIVGQAMARDDLLVPIAGIFPLEVHWDAKSLSVGRILEKWNIGPSDVVFVDDSPLELADVSAVFPEIECLQYPTTDAQGVVQLVEQLRRLFGKTEVREEDRLRVESLRSAQDFQRQREVDPERLLKGIEAEFTLDWNGADPRCLELINKTNQFNLNGTRWDEREWLGHLEGDNSFVLAVQYRDKFGPLGKIAVVAGSNAESSPRIDAWVMSCRAFSRRVEYQVLRALFEEFATGTLRLSYGATDRNGPMRDMLEGILGSPPVGPTSVSLEQFREHCPPLYGSVIRK